MSFQNPKSEPFKPGMDAIPVGALNRLRDGMPRQLRGGGSVEVEAMGDRLIVRDRGDQRGVPDHGNYYAQFVVRQELDDCLLCTPFVQPVDGTSGMWEQHEYDPAFVGNGTMFVYVAKPFYLRKTPWDGKTVTVAGDDLDIAYHATNVGERTITDPDGVVQTQKISPPYLQGDVIWALRGMTGVVSPGGVPAVWVDVNGASRQWVSTGYTFPGDVPASVIGAYFAGPVNLDAVLAVVNNITTTNTAKYETWWRIANVSHPYAIYLAGGDRRATPASNVAWPADLMIFLPFLCPRACVLKQLIVYTPVAPVTGNVRLGVYSDNGGFAAVDLLDETAQLDASSVAGALIGSVDVDVVAYQLVWIAMVCDGVNLMCRPITEAWPILGHSSLGYGGFADGPDTVGVGSGGTWTYGPLPASSGSVAAATVVSQANNWSFVPWLGVRIENP